MSYENRQKEKVLKFLIKQVCFNRTRKHLTKKQNKINANYIIYSFMTQIDDITIINTCFFVLQHGSSLEVF